MTEDSASGSYHYLVSAECWECEEVILHAEEFDDPVALDRDVPLSADYCPSCGHFRPDWMTAEEHEIEKVLPTQERESGQQAGENDD